MENIPLGKIKKEYDQNFHITRLQSMMNKPRFELICTKLPIVYEEKGAFLLCKTCLYIFYILPVIPFFNYNFGALVKSGELFNCFSDPAQRRLA